jgi:hypothetical protein
MKKILSILFVVTFVTSFVSCKLNSVKTDEQATTEESSVIINEEDTTNVLTPVSEVTKEEVVSE